MAEEHSPDDSLPNPPDDGALSNQELDEVLAQASSLADELSEQVGHAEDQEPQGKHGEPPASATDLDAELSELERLVADASSEVDEEPHSTGQGATLADELSAPQSGDPSIPDFMAEFTRPEGPDEEQGAAESPPIDAPSGPPATSEAADHSSKASGQHAARITEPGVVGTGVIGVVGRQAPPPTDHKTVETSEPAGPMKGDDGTAAVRVGRVTVRLRDIARRAFGRLSPIALKLCDGVLRLIEVADRPFARLGTPARTLIGWVAIATVGTAAIVFIISLF
jgi:hypothetical protein